MADDLTRGEESDPASYDFTQPMPWLSYERSSMLAPEPDSLDFSPPSTHYYPPPFEQPTFWVPNLVYHAPMRTGTAPFESSFQPELLAPPTNASGPFQLDTSASLGHTTLDSTCTSSTTVAPRVSSQPRLRAQPSIPSPFPAYRSIQSFPVSLPHRPHSDFNALTDDISYSPRRQGTDRTVRSSSPSEVVEESTAFISKLYHILSQPEYSKYLAWNESGDAFLLMNATEFAQEILPRFFRHSNISSFVRQLRLYGFTRVSTIRLLQLADQSDHPDLVAQSSTGPPFQSASGFAHPLFLRGRNNLLGQLKPRSSRRVRRAASTP